MTENGSKFEKPEPSAINDALSSNNFRTTFMSKTLSALKYSLVDHVTKVLDSFPSVKLH